MTNVKAEDAKFKGYALVRDKNGKPKIDDPYSIPKPIFDMLTEQEKEDLYHGNYPQHCRP